LLDAVRGMTVRDVRNRAMLALLIGCGLRRGELLALTHEAIQQRDEHWAIVDLRGKAGQRSHRSDAGVGEDGHRSMD
jgi:site-specific recombinase XerD